MTPSKEEARMNNPFSSFWRRRRALRHLPRFVRGELPTAHRREVAHALDDDPQVYAAYRQHRHAAQQFEADLGGVGRAPHESLRRGWDGVARALDGRAPAYRFAARSFDWRVRVAAVGMAAALLIPIGLGAGVVAASGLPPTPPAARIAQYAWTPTSDHAATDPMPDETPFLATAQLVIRATPTPTGSP
jgi:hypothetical protein